MGAPSMQCFKLEQTFFGFKQSDRVKMHDQLFDMIWIGEGRWQWSDVYYMPIFLRRFYVKKLNKIFEDRKKMQEKASRKLSPKEKIKKPPK